ncbi:MAG: hypothetical protein ABIJ28_01645 [Patescibacteria group bacterium]
MKKQNQKGISFLEIIVIIAIIALIGGIGYVWIQKNKTEEPKTENYNLELDISIPKDTYKVGEKFTDGKYLLSYNGDPFKAIVLYAKSRKGFEDKVAYSKTVGSIKTGDFDSSPGLREALQAFKIDQTGFEVGKDSFQEAGEYIFTMSVYRCLDIGLEDKDCLVSIPTEFILKFKPLKSVLKTITVSESTIQGVEQISREKCYSSSDCKEGFHCFDQECINNDILKEFSACEKKVCEGEICRYNICLQECQNCKDNKMVCLLTSEKVANEKCVECFIDSQCKSGYTCQEYKCK